MEMMNWRYFCFNRCKLSVDKVKLYPSPVLLGNNNGYKIPLFFCVSEDGLLQETTLPPRT